MDASDHDSEGGLSVLGVQFHRPNAYILTVRGVTGPGSSDVLDHAFTRATAVAQPVIVDLGALEFGDATLLGHLLGAYQSHRAVLVGPLSASFSRRLAITGAASVFTVHATLTQALNGITLPPGADT
ncbi:STAS domain-containing protein [Streptomyces rubiginosohelvolus]|uniref:Anti-sigma factor antagonist n=1 Tax=Streptomyces rubiginosohelvolus TaxID=67362 RepID=A0ABW6F8X7_9ACTN